MDWSFNMTYNAKNFEQDEFQERVIEVKRVSKKTRGGNKIGFTALVVVGNKKDKVGMALGKALDVTTAVQKAVAKAKREVVNVNLKGTTIPHTIEHKNGAARILLKPAPQGSGIIAGGSIRPVLELAGIKDISAKMLGSSNKNTNVKCAVLALARFRSTNA